jgi:ribosomal 50S subunit-recycling heat shock protein
MSRHGVTPPADSGPSGESMRLDLFLKQSRLIPRRSLAREVCDQGGIWVNGHASKGSKSVKVGDLIQWHQRRRKTSVKVSKIPVMRPGKKDAAALYELVQMEILPEEN